MSDQNNNQEKIIEELKAEIFDLKNKLQIAEIGIADKKLDFNVKISNAVFFRFLQRNSIKSFDDLKNSDIIANGVIDLTKKFATGQAPGHNIYFGHTDMLKQTASDTENDNFPFKKE